ncbi:putative lipid phosphate phosphatase YodM [Chitiniphilus shinanonensis]|uniref:Lipid phosphate phosphatase YodM n=1 Tax=Chitiniphilus shinanonensis TaxID=553088 RepID=A0ABQ6BMT7_9NEIS|nr:phosphatase PAP2 family protein [Chitiniphilus shinanonensis]GLS02969.1 putative lipid phosphate phosphatase YodM [Chitiniphilus shinanonensis]
MGARVRLDRHGWLALGGVLGFLVLWAALRTPAIAGLDDWVAASLYDLGPRWVLAAKWIAHAGSFAGSLAIAVVLGGALYRLGRIAFPGLPLFVLLVWGTNSVLKLLVDRQRPDVAFLMTVHGSSFPSGHAMAAAALGGAGAWLLCRCWPATRALWIALGTAWMLGGGLARVVLGVHHFSDIMAGYAAAAVLVAAYLHLAPRLSR